MKIDDILTKWTSDGGRLNPGASVDQLRQLEVSVGCALPELVRRLYSSANGMEEGTLDPHGVNFWSIDKIVNKTYVVQTGSTAGLGFADVLVDSWFLLFRAERNALVVVNESTKKTYAPDKFWRLYLERPLSLDL